MWQCALLNGTFADSGGRATCHRHKCTSVVDYIGVRGTPAQFEVVQHAFEGLSNHSPLLYTLQAPPVRMQSQQSSQHQHDTTYKWIGGSSLDDYCTSWQAWERASSDPDFAARFAAIVNAIDDDLDAGVAKVE